MDRIRHFADLAIRRACALATLGILLVAVGLSGRPLLALRVTAGLLSLGAVILISQALRAEYIPYRRHSVWHLLDQFHGLPESRAQEIISRVMKETYEAYALRAAAGALLFWGLAVLVTRLG